MVVPETVVFAVDLAEESAQPVGRNWNRLDVIRHAITNFVQAKRWSCTQHKFALVAVNQDTCKLLPLGATSNPDRLLEALQGLQPSSSSSVEPQQEPQQQPASSSSSRAFDLGSLISAVQPLQQQPQQQHGAAVQPMLGGMLTPVSSSNSGRSSSSISISSQPQQRLRVVLVYCRSRLPAPVWHSNRQAGLAIDCLHVHDKPQPGDQQQQLQEVYSTLEVLVDKMAMRAGHASLIYETTAKNLGKLLSCMAVMLSHPAQRPPQALAQPPVDLAAAELQPLPSDEANAASGVQIVSPAKLSAAAAGAWARPLSAAAAAGGSSTPSKDTAAVPSWLQTGAAAEDAPSGWEQSQASSSSAWEQPRAGGDAQPSTSTPGVVTGVPLSCVQGVPDADDPTVGMNMEQNVALGLDARRNSANFAALAPTTAAELADLAESLRVSAVEGPEAAHSKGS